MQNLYTFIRGRVENQIVLLFIFTGFLLLLGVCFDSVKFRINLVFIAQSCNVLDYTSRLSSISKPTTTSQMFIREINFIYMEFKIKMWGKIDD